MQCRKWRVKFLHDIPTFVYYANVSDIADPSYTVLQNRATRHDNGRQSAKEMTIMLTSGPILFLLLKQVLISTKNLPGYTPERTKLILKFRNFLGEAPQTFLKESNFLQVFVAWFVPPLISGWHRPCFLASQQPNFCIVKTNYRHLLFVRICF